MSPGTVSAEAITAHKKKAFGAILAAERPYLTAIDDLFAALAAEVAAA